MKNVTIVLLFLSIFYVHSCQSKLVMPPNMEMGVKFMQGIVNFCTNLHKTSIEEIVKTYNYEENNKNAKCAVMCVLQSAQMMDNNGNIASAEFLKVLEKLPDNFKKTQIQNTLNECLQEGSQDPCEKAFLFTKCILKIKDAIPVNSLQSMLGLFLK